MEETRDELGAGEGESTLLLRRTWGEQVAGHVGLGFDGAELRRAFR